MSSILDVIENKGLDLDKTEYYAAILGESPSKGARSPLLWNRAFNELGAPGFMCPMDVVSERLESVTDCLRSDVRFIGGAVTMPYKIDIIPFLDTLEPEAETIGAVNCIYRDGEKLVGSNTDGAGALWSLERNISEPLAGKTILQLGLGGAGYAVAAYLASAVGQSGRLLLANRTWSPTENMAARLKDVCKVEAVDQWPVPAECAADVNVLVNCTSVGFETLKQDANGVFSLKFYSPIGPVDDNIRVTDSPDSEIHYLKAAIDAISDNFKQTMNILNSMQNPVVFDIICQPEQTMLLYLAGLMGYKTLNGLEMNLEQAVIAFDKATAAAGIRTANADEVRPTMDNA